jgi:cytochrome b561
MYPTGTALCLTAIRPEERYLERKFDGAYRSYCNEVPRWLSPRRLMAALASGPEEQYVTSAAILRTHAYRPLGRGPDPFDLTLNAVHTRAGLLIFGLVALRLLLRVILGAPEWSRPLPPWRKRLSAGVQFGLYAVLLAEAATGAVASYVWWPMSVAHKALFWALAALVTVHLAGAALSFGARPRETLFRITGLRAV